MKTHATTVWSNIRNYLKENAFTCIAFFFLLVIGIAAGMAVTREMYQDAAAKEITGLPVMLQVYGIPWVKAASLCLSVHLFFFCMLFLSGVWLFTAPLWPVALLLQGLVIGAGLGACAAALPKKEAILLLLLLWVDVALLLPPTLRMSVTAGKKIVAKGSGDATAFEAYARNYTRAAAGLLLCMFLECLLMPLVLYLFG